MSRREAARVFGIDRRTVEKMLRFLVPPGYRRSTPVRRPKLDPLVDVIDRILGEDSDRPKKQRHTSNLSFDEWTSVFGSERLTGALLDRLTHHVHILEMNGESHRLALSLKAAEPKQDSAED